MQMRETKQKQAVMRVIREACHPLTVQEVLVEGQAHLPKLGLATVYREISRLSESGELQTVSIPGDPPRYEMARHHHHHFKCTICNRVYELEGCPASLAKLVPKGFRAERHDLTFYGSCAHCH
jgi:Fur family ferric uptake transcriptional regulator